MSRILMLLLTVFLTVTAHAQTPVPKFSATPDVGFAIIKTSQVAVAQALLVPGGSIAKKVDSSFSAYCTLTTAIDSQLPGFVGCAPAADALGRSGVAEKVDRHFRERCGAAILVSVIDGLVATSVERTRGDSSAEDREGGGPGAGRAAAS